MSEKQEPKKIGFLSIILSVLSAFIGVQSNKSRERDFAKGKLWHYILVGFLVTIAFMLTVWFAVVKVLESAQVST